MIRVKLDNLISDKVESILNYMEAGANEGESLGAYHLAKKSGNFGLRSNGKAIFRKIFLEIVDNLQR